jgi:hypothetical protein
VRGVGGKYILKLVKHEKGQTIFGCGNITNFLISDFIAEDVKTKFSCICFYLGANNVYPKNAVIKNIVQYNADYGYGIVQTQAAENVLFKNFDCEGGVALRIETGEKVMNDKQIGGVDKIFGRNISCKNGNAAVMVSPHSMHNGTVDIDGVTSENCGFGVRIGAGFVSDKQTNPNLTPGTFTEVKIDNVDATFGFTAQIKKGHFPYIPVYHEKHVVDWNTAHNTIGPAIAAVLFSGNYKPAVTIGKVIHHHFYCQDSIIDEDDKHPELDCDTTNNWDPVPTITKDAQIKITSQMQVFPNPTSKSIQIIFNRKIIDGSKIVIVNSQGTHVLATHIHGDELSLQVGHLAAGVYMIHLVHGRDTYYSQFKKL